MKYPFVGVIYAENYNYLLIFNMLIVVKYGGIFENIKKRKYRTKWITEA
jgi:hypothetical protein